jgi:hypothetical protein
MVHILEQSYSWILGFLKGEQAVFLVEAALLA